MSDRPVVSVEEIEAEGEAFSIRSESLENLRGEWIALHQACGAPGPFQRPEWHEVWLRHFGAGVEPVYLAVRRGETLIGVAALSLDRGVARELGDPGIRDYGGPLAAEGFENDVVLALLDWVAEDLTPVFDLWGMRRGDQLLTLFQAEAADNGWDLIVEDEAVAPIAVLPPAWDDYLAGLSKHDRHELRRKLRHLDEKGDVAYTTTSNPDDVAALLPTLFAFMRASHEGKAAFLTPEMEAFFVDLAATFAPAGLMRLGTLAVSGTPIAMLYTFEDDRGVYLYNSGFDPDWAPFAAGLLSKAYTIRDAIDRGKSTFHFLRGSEDYKKRLGGTAHTLHRLHFTRRG